MAERSIDDLPEGVLLHILSLLSTYDAVRASLISRKWRDLWHHIPSLNFDMLKIPNFNIKKILDNDINNFADFITKTLLLRPKTTPLHSFHLVFRFREYNHKRGQSQIATCIRHAVTSGTAVLRLFFFQYKYDRAWMYHFHFSDLKSCRCSVRILELNSCRIVWPVSVPDYGFPSISSVSLENVYIDNDEVLSGLVLSCVNLEFLSLSNLKGLKNLKIHSRTLKEFELYDLDDPVVESLDICAPNLRKISVDLYSVTEKYFSRDLSSLVEARVVYIDRGRGLEDFNCTCYDILSLVSGVERLTLDNWHTIEGFEQNLHKHPAFKNLKYLELMTALKENDLDGIAGFLEQCPQLESLVLDSQPALLNCDYRTGKTQERKIQKRLCEGFRRKPITFNIPKLKQVKLKNFYNTSSELYVVKLLEFHKVVLEKIVAFPMKRYQQLPRPLVLFDESKRLGEVMTATRILSLFIINSFSDIAGMLTKMLQDVDPNDYSAVEDELIVILVKKCRAIQRELMEMLATTGDEELLCHGLELKDSLQNVLAKHDTIAYGSPLLSDQMGLSDEEEKEKEDDFALVARSYVSGSKNNNVGPSEAPSSNALVPNPINVPPTKATNRRRSAEVIGGHKKKPRWKI